MDEAVLRIVIDDAGGDQPPVTSSIPPAPTSLPPTPSPQGNRPPPPSQPKPTPAPPPPASVTTPPVSTQTTPLQATTSALDLTTGEPQPIFQPVPAQIQTATPAPTKTDPVPVELTKPPDPTPPPAAPPDPKDPAQPPKPDVQPPPDPQAQQPNTDPDWMKSLIDPSIQGPGYNPHVLLEGQSGGGKSVAARHIAMQRMEKGEETHVLDPHNPSSWGGAKQVFQGQSAAEDTAKFMMDTLKGRIKEGIAAEAKGEKLDFKPINIVLSDFARLIRESPQLQTAIKDVAQEGRKYRIQILADAANLRAADVGGNIGALRRNIGQQVQFYPDASSASGRKADVEGVAHDVPVLPDYANKADPSLIKPGKGGYQAPVGAEAIARREMEKEKLDKEVWQQRMKLDPAFRQREQDKYARSLPKAIPIETEKQFDPLAEAHKRRESQQRSAQVDDAYKKEYGDPKKKGPFDAVLDMATQLRGTIGGLFGTLAGATLDAVQGIRKANAQQEDERQKRKLVAEARVAQSPPKAILIDQPEAPPTALPVEPPKQASPMPPPMPVTEKAPPTPNAPIANTIPTAQIVPEAKTAPPPPTATIVPPDAKAAPEVSALGSAAGGVASKMAMMVPVIAAATVTFGALQGALDGAVKRYGEYSYDIARAEANVEVRKINNDIRRSEQYGPELAKYVESQGRMQESFEEAKMKILIKLAPVVETVSQMISEIVTINSAMMDVIGFVPKQLISIAKSAGELLGIKQDERKDADSVLDEATESDWFKGDPGAASVLDPGAGDRTPKF